MEVENTGTGRRGERAHVHCTLLARIPADWCSLRGTIDNPVSIFHPILLLVSLLAQLIDSLVRLSIGLGSC